MGHNHTATIHHMHHYSFKDFKNYLSSHIELFENMLEKAMEAGALIVVAGFIYAVILVMLTLNHANHAYSHGISCIACDSIQIIYSSIQGFI
jgi:hypothetical protein